MSDADINDLNLREPDQIEWDDYEPSKAGGTIVVLPPRGTYMVIPIEPPVIGATKADKYLQFQLGDLAIQAPNEPYDQSVIRFTNVNVKKWPKRNASGVGDYLVSHGYVGNPRTNNEYIEAVQGLVGHPCYAVVDWEAYCNVCKATIKGEKNFPMVDGVRQSRILCPSGCKVTMEQNGKQVEVVKMLFANARIVSFVPPPKE